MSHQASAWISLLPDDDIPFILTCILRCGSVLRKKKAQEREDHLSDRLRKLVYRDEAFRNSKLRVDREIPVYDNDEEGQESPIGRIDFRFLNPHRDTEWCFTVEAKRLHVVYPKKGWKSYVSEYATGHQGMMCFITQRYSRGLYNGAMLGYVFDGEIEKARGAIKTAIEENNLQLKHKLKPGFGPSTIQYDGAVISESVHELDHGDFTIYHLFLAV